MLKSQQNLNKSMVIKVKQIKVLNLSNQKETFPVCKENDLQSKFIS